MTLARRPLAILALLIGTVQSADAALIFFSDRASFNAANPGLPVEGFEDADTTSSEGFTGPLSSTSSNPPAFSPGDILPGVTFQTTTSNDMFLAGAGQSSNPTLAIGVNDPESDAMEILFAPGVSAAAFDLFQNFGGGSQSGTDQDYLVQIFGTGGLIGSTTVTVPSGSAGFFGVQTTIAGEITEINANNLTAFEVIDDVAFGGAPGVAVPLPGTAALVITGAAAMIGYLRVQRRQGRNRS